MTKNKNLELILLLDTIESVDGKRLSSILHEVIKESSEHAAPLKEKLLLTRDQLKEAIDALSADQKPEPLK